MCCQRRRACSLVPQQATNVDVASIAKAEFPEVVWGEGKSAQHIAATLQRVADRQGMAVATRVNEDVAAGESRAGGGWCWAQLCWAWLRRLGQSAQSGGCGISNVFMLLVGDAFWGWCLH